MSYLISQFIDFNVVLLSDSLRTALTSPQIILLLAGLVFILIALIGGNFTVMKITIPKIQNWARIGSAAIGIALLVIFTISFFNGGILGREKRTIGEEEDQPRERQQPSVSHELTDLLLSNTWVLKFSNGNIFGDFVKFHPDKSISGIGKHPESIWEVGKGPHLLVLRFKESNEEWAWFDKQYKRDDNAIILEEDGSDRKEGVFQLIKKH